MKQLKTATLVSLVALLLLAALFSYGSKFLEYNTVPLTDGNSGLTDDYVTTNLTIGGKDIITDVPAILYNVMENGVEKTRTLVPIRVISETLGAEVSWDGASKTARIIYAGKVIELTIDQKTAMVNGQPVTLPNGVPAKLMQYQGINRTLVPVRFVSEQLGLEVAWDSSTRTVLLNREIQKITDVLYTTVTDFQEIVIKTSGRVDATSYYIDGDKVGVMSKLVLEIPNSDMKLSDTSKYDQFGDLLFYVNERGLSSVYGDQLKDKVFPTTRFEIDMYVKRGYEIYEEDNQVRIVFANAIQDIRAERLYNSQTVVVRTMESPTFNVIKQGQNVIVDIFDTKLSYDNDGKKSINVSNGGINYISFDQLNARETYDEDRTMSRIVVALEDSATADQVYVEGIDNQVVLYVSGNPMVNFNYQIVDQSKTKIAISGGDVSSYQLDQQADNLLKIYIPKDKTTLNDFAITPDDLIVEQIYVDRNSDYYIVNAQLAEGTTYQITSNEGSEYTLVFNNDKLNQIAATGQLVVVDAGHGGGDPGAVSPIDKTQEKDIVLKAALKLQKKLSAMGYRVYLTRDYDTYVNLRARASIANELGADVFISVHANAATNSKAYGIETLYRKDARNSYAFAKAIQKGMINATGGKSRGVINRPELAVLRLTVMPAALVEIGFVTNPTELANLKNDSYLDKVITGIVDGVNQYYK